MKLQHNQARRFERIFDALLSYAAEQQGVLEALRSNNHMLSGQTSLDLIDSIWNRPDGIATIDEFIGKNPKNFNRTDLREVESWKLGVHAHFVVVDFGPQSVFMAYGCAFNVRGINNEIATVFGGRLPGFVDGVVLPFDRTITIGSAILPTPMGAAMALRLHFHSEVLRIEHEHLSARNARDFLRIAPIALENKRREAESAGGVTDESHVSYDFAQANDLEDITQATSAAPSPVQLPATESEELPEAIEEPTPGPAVASDPEPEATVTPVPEPVAEPEDETEAEPKDAADPAFAAESEPEPEAAEDTDTDVESEQASEDATDVATETETETETEPEPEVEAVTEAEPEPEVDPATLIADVQAQCRKGRPTQGLKGYTGAFKKQELLEIARTYEGIEASNSLKKGELVTLVIENASFDTEKILDIAHAAGPEAVCGISRIVQASGRLRVPFAEVTDATSVPVPVFPITQLFQVDESFVWVMPNEVKDALADVSWDEI